MWTCNLKKSVLVAGLILSLTSAPAYACNPLNPICLFKMLLKATPGLPTFDFVSVPAIIPHIPAAVLKEGQQKLKELADNGLDKIRSGELPSLSSIDLKVPSFQGSAPAQGQEYASLEGFPEIDSEDPLEIAKAIEILFLRPGWDQKGETSEMTTYDTLLMKYYRNKFKMNNTVEISGYLAMMQGKVEELVAQAESIQKEIDAAKNVNQAQRANYSAHLMEYQLMIVYNQLLAAQMQMETADRLADMEMVLEEPVLRSM